MTTNRSEAQASFGAWWFLVPVAATVNLGSLIVVLYAGRVHPVRYYLELVPVRELSWVLFALSAAGAATVLVILRWAAASYRGRAPGGAPLDGRRAVWRACLPAAAAPAWSAFLVDSPHADLLILFSCICLFAWTSSRFVGGVLGYGKESGANDGSQREVYILPSSWWRDSWFIALLVIVAALTVFHTNVQIGMYNALRYGSPDIGYYAEMLNNAARGRGLRCEAYGHDFFWRALQPRALSAGPSVGDLRSNRTVDGAGSGFGA